ncbi:MAG: hypothetical protein VCD00_06785 [Candidatus Hydrogenedentota bacterium]
MRDYKHSGTVDAIREAGGEIYAITSEPHSLALNAQEHWETGFDHIGDPHQEILAECSERGWLSLFIWQHAENSSTQLTEWVSHPKGYFQPGVLALNQEKRVLYRWRSRPDRQNIGGAAGRPTAAHVWECVQAALEAPSDAQDVSLDESASLDGLRAPWPIFLALLIGNGWFLKPVFFGQRTGKNPKDSLKARIRNAQLRLMFFIIGWIAAFAILPLWIPIVALAGWVAWIAPKINKVNKGFQNVRSDEEPAEHVVVD